jgi:hypothetical protein
MLMQVEFESRVKNETIAIPKATPLSILQEKMKGKALEAGFNNIEDIVGYIKKIDLFDNHIISPFFQN